MKVISRIMLSLLLVAFLFSVSASPVSAGKRIYKATLTTSAELHEVVGSSARGSAILGFNLDGSLRIQMSVRGLTSVPSGAHIHGPATTEENAGVLVTLCGNPTPGVVATCTLNDEGLLVIEGNIPGYLLRGVTAAQFMSWLDAGMLYINVHTTLNPAGEVRGQIIRQ
jgi:hypothetical protein